MTNTKTYTTVPAQPGFAILHLVYLDGRVFDLRPEPIIAWVIESWVERDGNVRASGHAPVTYNGLPDPDEYGPPAVLFPDGTVDLQGVGTFANAGKFLLYSREEVDDFNQRKALEVAGN